jgi:hypothetical protein
MQILSFDFESFQEDSWRTLIQSGIERTVFHELDHNGQPIPVPSLDDEWLTLAEICLQQVGRCQRQNRQACARQNICSHVRVHEPTQNDSPNDRTRHTGPVSAPEGEGHSESITGSSPASQPPVDEIVFDDTNVDFDEDLDKEPDLASSPRADDERLIRTLEPYIEPDDIPPVVDDVPDLGTMMMRVVVVAKPAHQLSAALSNDDAQTNRYSMMTFMWLYATR